MSTSRVRRMISSSTRECKKAPFFQIDSFSKLPFGGNPAAVLLIPSGFDPDDGLMKRVAAENNLSETAFLKTMSDKEGDGFGKGTRFALRWFTPTVEVDLCGHGTLAAAAALFSETVANPAQTLTFSTKSGDLKALRRDDGMIGLDFPLNPPRTDLASLPENKQKALQAVGAAAVEGSGASIVELAYNERTKKMVVRVEGEGEGPLRSVCPSPDTLLAVHDGSVVTGVSVTTAGAKQSEHDFHSRYFAPWNGIPEDPVNGSSHTVLTPYWSKILGGKTRMLARQSSDRGGDLALELLRRSETGRVSIAGHAVIVIEGGIVLS